MGTKFYNLPTPNDELCMKKAPMQIPMMIKILKNQNLDKVQNNIILLDKET